MRRRSNHALVSFDEHLGPDADALDVPWATFARDRTSERAFEVPTDDPRDAYVHLQAYEVDAYSHDILLNDEPLSGFDIPPADGWQSWIDPVTGTDLQEGKNAIRIRRDVETGDSFVVGSVVVSWTEPVEG